MTVQPAFPRERKKSQLIMVHTNYAWNFNNDPCQSVCPCFWWKMSDHQSIKFYSTGATHAKWFNKYLSLHKRTRSTVAYKGKKNFHKTVIFDHQLLYCHANLLDLSPALWISEMYYKIASTQTADRRKTGLKVFIFWQNLKRMYYNCDHITKKS